MHSSFHTINRKYRIWRESISVEELATFAETGVSTSLPKLALARQDPKIFRRYLTQPIKVNPVLLDRLLNSQIENILLDEISQVHTPFCRANNQALRSAVIISASGDRQITVI